ncbi:MAG: transposase [Bdellovibrionales bacterium]|nr:transposase [Bdellovibrionales bacterium]
MPRNPLIRSDLYPYHVTARTNNREPFPTSLDKTWELINSECFAITTKFESEIHALVLMPNHFHLLITIPQLDLGKVMNVFIRNITKDSHSLSGKTGRLFGARYHWSSIQTSHYYLNALKYVYRNPIRAKICDTVDTYPYSTYSGLIGNHPLKVPIQFTRLGLERILGDEPLKWNSWLNQPFSSECETLIRMGLKRTCFRPPHDPKTRTPNKLEEYDSSQSKQ